MNNKKKKRQMNMFSLWDDALSLESIPAIPSYELVSATGGETTYDLETRRSHISQSREALPGEVLRQPNLRFCHRWEKNIEWRAAIQTEAATKLEFRELQLVFCKSSFIYWINTFCWTYNPRLPTGEMIIPFVTYPYQEQAATWFLNRIKRMESGLVEKSREMGASWLAAALAVWLVIFHSGYVVYFMSMTEDSVDNRAPDSLLGK